MIIKNIKYIYMYILEINKAKLFVYIFNGENEKKALSI